MTTVPSSGFTGPVRSPATRPGNPSKTKTQGSPFLNRISLKARWPINF